MSDRTQDMRSLEILRCYDDGVSVSTIAARYGLTRQRVYQLLRQHQTPRVSRAHSLRHTMQIKYWASLNPRLRRIAAEAEAAWMRSKTA